jgi:hypothetical protein
MYSSIDVLVYGLPQLEKHRERDERQKHMTRGEREDADNQILLQNNC